MSQEKAQLIAPLGNVTFSGVTATGVITATSLEGNITGSATSIKQGTSITAGVVTASSFAGNLTGNIQRLADSAPNISVGVVTATSFSGNLTGSVTDLTATPDITVGIVTATRLKTAGTLTGDVTGNVTGNVSGVATGSVTGNVTGLASSVRSGVNLNVGVATGIQWHGDGSNLTGAGSTALIAQEITASGAETIIDLSDGNLIYFDHNANTTVGFASTSAAEQITLIRTVDNSYTITWPNTVTWNDGTTPTLMSNDYSGAFQIFHFTTGDTGASYQAWEEMKNSNIGADYNLFVWGINQSGNLGLNSPSTSPVSSPTQIPGTNWSILSTSVGNGGHNSVLKSDGTLWIWGSSATGKLGNNTGPGKNVSSPIQVGTDTTWKTVNLGSDHAVSTKTDGTLWSWGSNFAGVLGQNNNTNYSSPVQIGSGTDWATGKYQITGGVGCNGVIKTDGTLWSWGYNQYGTLGHNNRTSYSSPRQIGTNTNWRSIAQHYYGGVMMATKTDGTLWAWGENSEGGIGVNNRTQYSSPVQIPGTNWNQVTPYGGWQCTVVTKTDGTLWAWGNNDNGTAGQNNTNNGYSSPVQIPGTTWKECGTGDNGCAAGLKTDGTLWTWGVNQTGVLGLNQTANNVRYSSPVQIPGTNWITFNLNGVNNFALRS